METYRRRGRVEVFRGYRVGVRRRQRHLGSSHKLVGRSTGEERCVCVVHVACAGCYALWLGEYVLFDGEKWMGDRWRREVKRMGVGVCFLECVQGSRYCSSQGPGEALGCHNAVCCPGEGFRAGEPHSGVLPGRARQRLSPKGAGRVGREPTRAPEEWGPGG